MSLETELINFLQDPERKKQLMSAAENALTEKITEKFKWDLPDVISNVCNEFIKEEIAPEVRSHLINNKGVILKAAKDAADEIGDKLAETMVEKATERLNNYYADDIIRSIFTR